MNFTSAVFLIFFPVVWFIYWEVESKYRKYVLLVASLIFYGYFSLVALLWLLLTITITYLAGVGSEKYMQTGRNLWRLTKAIGIILPLALLVMFKYTPVRSILLPAGISFYTFQTISYVIDVWSGKFKCEESFVNYMLYVCFFPQLVAGPIERANHLLPQLREPHTLNRSEQGQGLTQMAIGFLQKAALADTLAPLVDMVYGNLSCATGPDIILATFAFSLQIYFDFAGYSNIAIGAAKMLGISLIENFDHPYLKGSIREFWKSWHKSLTGWLTEYVYIPLGGSKAGKLRTAVNIMIVFLLSGIWHGAGIGFAIWGLLHGTYLIIERCFYSNLQKLNRVGWTIYHLWCLILVDIAWVFFRIQRISDLPVLLSRLTKGWSIEQSSFDLTTITSMGGLGIFILGAALAFVDEKRLKKNARTSMELILISCIIIAVALIRNLGADISNAFIYFAF